MDSAPNYFRHTRGEFLRGKSNNGNHPYNKESHVKWWTQLTVAQKIIVTFTTAFILTLITGAIFSPKSHADGIYDVHMPIPVLNWCPGGGGQGGGWGGYCDGRPYADGTFWHTANAMGFSSPIQCVINNGTAMPAPAPWGCVG